MCAITLSGHTCLTSGTRLMLRAVGCRKGCFKESLQREMFTLPVLTKAVQQLLAITAFDWMAVRQSLIQLPHHLLGLLALQDEHQCVSVAILFCSRWTYKVLPTQDSWVTLATCCMCMCLIWAVEVSMMLFVSSLAATLYFSKVPMQASQSI